MNILQFAGLAMLAAAGTASAAIDPVLLNLVMPDATVLSGMQVQQTIASPFGMYILSQMDGAQSGNADLLKFFAATGFDPRRDLTELLAATSATGTGSKSGLVLGRGTFQPAQIQSAAAAAGGTVTTYRGMSIITGSKGAGGIVFFDSTTAAMGDLASVQAAIDRRVASATFSGSLASKAQGASAANQAWFATVTPLSDFLNGKLGANMGGAAQNNLFQSVQQASGGVAFGPNSVVMSGDAVTSSPQNAQALVDVLKFVTSMIQTNNANNPNNTVATLADSATFSVNGSTAHLSLPLTEQQAEQLFNPQLAGKAVAHGRHQH